MANKSIFRLGIDARLAGTKHAGIGRYSENLIQRLIKLNSNETAKIEVKLILFFFDRLQANKVLGQLINSKQIEIIIAPIKHYGLAEQLLLPKIYKSAKLDLLFVPHWNIPMAYQGKLAITIHDLLWHEQKGLTVTTLQPWIYVLKYWIYRLVSQRAANKARVIFVPTQTIKATVARYYPSTTDKIVVSKEGIASLYEKRSQEKIMSDQGKLKVKKQLIYTGSLYPHKNIKLVIQSLKKLPKYKLLIASSRNIFQDQLQTIISNYKVKNQVEFLGFVPDEQLIALYKESTALVQPSLSEGFGLTGIEAMASHLPVLASDIQVFREIYQDAAFFFDPKSCDSFVTALKHLESSNRQQVIKRGLKITKQYSFDQMATEVWEKLLENL